MQNKPYSLHSLKVVPGTKEAVDRVINPLSAYMKNL